MFQLRAVAGTEHPTEERVDRAGAVAGLEPPERLGGIRTARDQGQQRRFEQGEGRDPVGDVEREL